MVLNKTQLCHCSVQTTTEFLPEIVSACPTTPKVFAFNYTHNSAVAYFYIKQHLNSKYNFSDLLPKPSDLTLRELQTRSINNTNTLYQVDGTSPVALEHLVNLMYNHSNEEIYLTQGDKLQVESQIDSWFKGSNIGLAILFILGLIGAMAFLVVIILCCRQHRMAGVIGAALHNVQRVDAADCVDNDFYGIPYFLVTFGFTLALFIVFRLLRKLFRQWYPFRIYLPTILTSYKSDTFTDIFIEMVSFTTNVKLYVSTIKLPIAELRVNNQVRPEALMLTGDYLSYVLNVTPPLKVLVGKDKLSISLPTFVHVPFYKVSRIRHILNEEMIIRVLIVSNK